MVDNGEISVKALSTGVSLAGIIVFSVSVAFILIEALLIGTLVGANWRSMPFKHATLQLIFNVPLLWFFWVSYYGYAVFIALPGTEVEFWFWVVSTISLSAYILSWSLRVGPDVTNVDVSSESVVNNTADSGEGRALIWAFITAAWAIAAAFGLFDLTNLMLPFGITAIVITVFWLIFWWLSLRNAMRRDAVVKRNGTGATNRNRYGWLKWTHIFIVIMWVFLIVLYILGPGLTAVGDYSGIMIGYLITVGLIAVSGHVYFWVFDYNTPKVLYAEARPAGMRRVNANYNGNSVFATYGKTN